jgi:hypothetical protein
MDELKNIHNVEIIRNDFIKDINDIRDIENNIRKDYSNGIGIVTIINYRIF